LLKKKNIPFVIALNKIDRLYGWKENKNGSSKESLLRNVAVKEQFHKLYSQTITQLAIQEINATLYWENKDINEYMSIIPTSAITGEGICDLISQIVVQCQDDKIQNKFKQEEKFSANVMEVKVEEGIGATIDVILVSGELKVDDIIVVTGLAGPIITKIKSMMTPQPMKEMRVKGEYIMHKSMKGSIGIKLMGEGLSKALAGSEVYKASSEQEAQEIAESIKGELAMLLTRYINSSGEGVLVQSSTLGSLEAILEHLQKDKIPVAGVGIGELFKSDIGKLTKVIDKKDDLLEYKVIMAFEVKISPEAEKIAKDNDITIIEAKIIYHLFDKYAEYTEKVKKIKFEKLKSLIVFPCVLEIIPDAIFHNKKPLIFGVKVKSGILKKGTPLCVTDKDNTKIGVVERMEMNHKEVDTVKPKDGEVAIRLSGEDHIMFDRHFNAKSTICSIITRDSIDALKKCCRDILTPDIVELIVKLKSYFGIA
jgi:translation initiation factor IF-2